MSHIIQRRRPGTEDEEHEDVTTGKNVTDLRAYAKSNNISLKRKTRRAEIVKAIRDHIAAADNDEDDDDEDDEDDDDDEEEAPIFHIKMKVTEVDKTAKDRGVDLRRVRRKSGKVAAILAHVAATPAVEGNGAEEDDVGIEEPEDDSLHIEEPRQDDVAAIDGENAAREERRGRDREAEDFTGRERAIEKREQRVLEREKDYLRSREAAVEERERVIKEKEDSFAQKKRTLSEADPDHRLDERRPQKRRRIHSELEEEKQKDLPRPEVPEFLERDREMKLQRDGKDFKTKQNKDVKQWYQAGMEHDSSKSEGEWMYRKGVGEGAYGSCSIWVKVNKKAIMDVGDEHPSPSRLH